MQFQKLLQDNHCVGRLQNPQFSCKRSQKLLQHMCRGINCNSRSWPAFGWPRIKSKGRDFLARSNQQNLIDAGSLDLFSYQEHIKLTLDCIFFFRLEDQEFVNPVLKGFHSSFQELSQTKSLIL